MGRKWIEYFYVERPKLGLPSPLLILLVFPVYFVFSSFQKKFFIRYR